eukprot:COSAG02_NODE_1129_length_14415_cov_828.291911_5_plen_66_part_00
MRIGHAYLDVHSINSTIPSQSMHERTGIRNSPKPAFPRTPTVIFRVTALKRAHLAYHNPNPGFGL